MKYRILCLTIVILFDFLSVKAQVGTFPYSESFDGNSDLPADWISDGFIINTSVFRSSPHCLSTTGNSLLKTVNSCSFNLTNKNPDNLVFWERRSATAAAYRLEIRASVDGVTFNVFLEAFDDISSTSGYVQRIVDLKNAGLQNRPDVRFQWRLLGDNTNNTGILRIDDVTLTVCTGFDVGVTSIVCAPENADRKDTLVFTARIKNYGSFTASNFNITFFVDSDKDGLAEKEEIALESGSLELNAGDSLTSSASYKPAGAGKFMITAVVNLTQDENESNDTLSTEFIVKGIKGDVVINEIMYEPLAGQCEWIELYSRSTQQIDIAGWTLNDRSSSAGSNLFRISDSSIVINPGEFAVIAEDSTICYIFPYLRMGSTLSRLVVLNHANGFSLNNDGDDIVLKDIAGQSIDSVSYLPIWHHPDIMDTRGRSLERINPEINSNDPRNWRTCTNSAGGTPGRTNSVLTIGRTDRSNISISPNPFSPDADGFEDYCNIHYNFSMNVYLLSVKIFDIKGRCIRTLANCELSGTSGNIIWDGFDDKRQRARIGVYIIYIVATEQSSGRVESAKAAAVVAGRL
ncbi:MAG: lamin tail domain-containing protein [Bacteroidetes bacterium]|nr:lamin tail domain-containing protein [Bacteroidota bacterium]